MEMVMLEFLIGWKVHINRYELWYRDDRSIGSFGP